MLLEEMERWSESRTSVLSLFSRDWERLGVEAVGGKGELEASRSGNRSSNMSRRSVARRMRRSSRES